MEKQSNNKNIKYYAKVHSIESFGTVDGPGIRFVLFLQGCNLQCKYCHNRDTWDIHGGEFKSLDEIFEKIMRYKNYISPKGGVTVTGGEPLLQQDFLIELFKKLKKEKIHTCIDTSGMFELTDKIKELIDLTDLFLLDIKHIDSEKCKELVGISNKRELEFARYLSENNKHLWIRQVLIPGITDDKQDLLKLKDLQEKAEKNEENILSQEMVENKTNFESDLFLQNLENKFNEIKEMKKLYDTKSDIYFEKKFDKNS